MTDPDTIYDWVTKDILAQQPDPPATRPCPHCQGRGHIDLEFKAAKSRPRGRATRKERRKR